MQKKILEIKDKVYNNVRLDKKDALFLYESNDLLTLGELANYKKHQKSGKTVFFNVNRHINLTNICISRCKFCAFGVDEDGKGGPYIMSPDEALEFAGQAVPLGITEFHVVSAMHPKKDFAYYLEVIRKLHETYPDIHIQAFTAVEIFHFSKISNLSIKEVLLKLQKVGLGSIPGGGAEILNDDIRQELCPRKANSEEWLEVHRVAHNLGIKTNCTMLYGHIETIEDRVNHMISLRELQDEAPGFQSFIPLPFLPDNTRLEHITRTSAIDDIKTIAISRLMLDNIDHIKAFWVMLGIPIAQVSLNFGADDIDGTIVEERIMHAAGASGGRGITKSDIIHLINDAGFIPTERDTLYNVIKTYK